MTGGEVGGDAESGGDGGDAVAAVARSTGDFSAAFLA